MTKAWGIKTSDDDIGPCAASAKTGICAVLAEIMGLSREEMQKIMDNAGWQIVPVEITEILD